MLNPITRFQRLLPSSPLLYGTVAAHNANGATSRVTLPSGAVVVVRGQSVAIGANCWIQGGEIKGPAPSLPAHSAEV